MRSPVQVRIRAPSLLSQAKLTTARMSSRAIQHIPASSALIVRRLSVAGIPRRQTGSMRGERIGLAARQGRRRGHGPARMLDEDRIAADIEVDLAATHLH